MADDSGTVRERYTYYLAGNSRILSANDTQLSTSVYNNRFLFQGREYSSELGLYDYRNRIYFPQWGRFLQPDPIGFAGDGSNMYRHCGNNPINTADPTGEIPVYNIRGGWYTYWIDPGYLANVATTSTGLTWTGSMWADSTHWCAAGAQALSGAPDTSSWFEGASVTSATMYGTVIVTGWQGGGYPGSANQEQANHDFGRGTTLNHTGIFLGLDADGNAWI